MDISKFSIRSKGVSVSKALTVKAPKKHVTDWVLPNTNRSISVSELSGAEIEKLNMATESRNRLNNIRTTFSVIYEHILDANKPSTLEEWVKSISFFDIRHLYFAIYKACFENSNYIPYICSNPKCNNTFIIQQKIADMIKYKDEEAKEKIKKIFDKDSTSETGYDTSLVQISEDYCVTLRPPSIYNVSFETAVLDEAFSTKYSEVLSIISFIENIYIIDKEAQELIPVELKVDPDSLSKTVKYKIRSFYKVLSKLTSDEFAELSIIVNKMAEKIDDSCRYVYPEVVCPKCQQKIEETNIDPLQMVFTRHQLMSIANS